MKNKFIEIKLKSKKTNEINEVILNTDKIIFVMQDRIMAEDECWGLISEEEYENIKKILLEDK